MSVDKKNELRDFVEYLRNPATKANREFLVRKLSQIYDGLNSCVLQDWVIGLCYKKQTVLMEMIRAPDVQISIHFKQITTFVRATVLKNADPTTDFMKDAELPSMDAVQREFERLPQHCAHHILMTLEVIGYDHPNKDLRNKAFEFYQDGVHSEHLNIETKEEYEKRMSPRAYGTYKPA